MRKTSGNIVVKLWHRFGYYFPNLRYLHVFMFGCVKVDLRLMRKLRYFFPARRQSLPCR